MNAAIQKFQTIGFMRGGRISGFLDGKRTPFYMTKRLVEVPRIDEEGRPVRAAQWLIELEAPVDVDGAAAARRGLDAAELALPRRCNVLEGGCRRASVADVVGDDGVIDASARPYLGLQRHRTGSRSCRVAGLEQVRRAARPATRSARREAHRREQAAAKRRRRGCREVASGRRGAWCRWPSATSATPTKRWGRGWKMNADGRKPALDEVDRIRATTATASATRSMPSSMCFS